MSLRCSNILVIGGSSGMGKAIAKRLLRECANVVIAGRSADKLAGAYEDLSADRGVAFSYNGSDPAELEALLARVKLQAADRHTRLFTLEMDIGDCDAIPAKLAEADALLPGGLDGFVNAAALGGHQTFGRGYEPFDITPDEWDLLSYTNFKGAFFLMRDEINYLLGTGRKGNILTFASNAACMDVIGSYGAAKNAIIRWTRAFGKRYGEKGIIINGIAPGAVLTPMISSYAHSADQPYPRHAIGRFILPDEIAALASYLMSAEGEIVCGHTVVADGGDKMATL